MRISSDFKVHYCQDVEIRMLSPGHQIEYRILINYTLITFFLKTNIEF